MPYPTATCPDCGAARSYSKVVLGGRCLPCSRVSQAQERREEVYRLAQELDDLLGRGMSLEGAASDLGTSVGALGRRLYRHGYREQARVLNTAARRQYPWRARAH